MRTYNTKTFTAAGLLTAAVVFLASGSALAQQPAAAPPAFLPLPPASVSTVPSNGDVNPYGVAFVSRHVQNTGVLQPGDILVSNFNNNQNLQGTGTTIIRVTEKGQTSTFFQGSAGLGLTAALRVVQRGFVFVGNMPTTDGTSNTVQPGSLLILDNNGKLLVNFSDTNFFNGPWGMAVNDLVDGVQVFISNVLDGTVVRLDIGFPPFGSGVQVWRAVRIASGYKHRTDPAALVLGPSGLSYDDANDILYVASSFDNAVYAIPSAGAATSANGTGTMVYQDNTHLHGPLDLVLLPSGNLIVANSDGSNADPNQPSELVEFTTAGRFVAQYSVDPNNGGAFGIGSQRLGESALRFAAVDDNQNKLTMWTQPLQ